ncbi:MAG: hypothetical protein H0T44_13785 [Gemmatimonadales bacterium]|nr:hypothetical protein [Gemmatimonadales bacterium]
MDSALDATVPDGHLPRPAAAPLVPILAREESWADPATIASWHDALSGTLAVEVPHDLLALWLYPVPGEAVLVGPTSLAEDRLDVPPAAPLVEEGRLLGLEEFVRAAGYGSAVVLPIRLGRRDVGLVLIAALRADRYGETERAQLGLVADGLAHSFARWGRRWGTLSGETEQRPGRMAALLDGVAMAIAEAASPEQLVEALSRTLQPILPHDHLQLFSQESKGWGAFEELFGGSDWVLLPDASNDRRWPGEQSSRSRSGELELRAVVAARVAPPEGPPLYVLAGSVGRDLYDADDAALLVRLTGLIAPQMAVFAAATSGPSPTELLEVSELLATMRDLPEAMRRAAYVASLFLPFDEMRVALRLSQEDRVVLVAPGERRALAQLPSIPVADPGLARVLLGQSRYAYAMLQGDASLVVPLRVAGRILGAAIFTARHPSLLREVHASPAQRLADLIAPHFELLRRAGG